MYLNDFQLTRNPFPSTPQLDFFYSGGGRDSAINAIDFGLEENFGIIKVIGQTGVGKTMLCRQAYRQLADRYDILFISDPSLDSCNSILSAVASELNPEWDLTKPKNKLFQQIMQTLMQQQPTKPTVLFIEEAQKLTPAQFEELRYLTNLETDQDKLLQLVLFGQPSLDACLVKADVQLLSSRITHSVFLRPLSYEAFADYIHHRLSVAGHRSPKSLFSNAQLWAVYFLSNGSLRQANVLLEKILFACYLRKTNKPSLRDLTKAVRSMGHLGSEIRYTRAHMVSVFSVGLILGWFMVSSTAPLWIQTAQADHSTELSHQTTR